MKHNAKFAISSHDRYGAHDGRRTVMEKRRNKEEENRFTSMSRDTSSKAHVEELQMQFPAIGSQKGVEQLEGTGNWMKDQYPFYKDRNDQRTAEASCLSSRGLLRRVRVARFWCDLRASILRVYANQPCISRIYKTNESTHTSEEGEIRKRTFHQQTSLILRHSVTDLRRRVNRGYITLQGGGAA